MLIQSDARAIPLKDESVNCVVTSPPYWGLRDYGTAKWEGGSEGCDHKQSVARHDGGRAQVDGFHGSLALDSDKGAMNYRDICHKCGARRIDAQIGLEKTPEEYVQHIVEVFREVRRVLRKDGTAWVNLGDSYVSNGRYESDRSTYVGDLSKYNHRDPRVGARTEHLKPKDLCMIPARVALALQADGWWLRSDIIWQKPNPMPESVTDRPTRSHEYIFLLSKSERYYFDQDAVREQSITNDPRRPYGSQGAWQMDGRPIEQRHGGEIRLGREGVNSRMHQDRDPNHSSARKVRSPAGWKTGSGSHGSIHENGREPEVTYNQVDASSRNIRSVWTVATQPYAEAHFATFPEDLIKPCILAGCPSRVCVGCGSPWERVTDKGEVTASGGKSTRYFDARRDDRELKPSDHVMQTHSRVTIGWQPTCKCGTTETRPGIVLDPFGGSCTTVKVSQDLGRRGVALDLKPEYLAMGKRRAAQQGLRL